MSKNNFVDVFLGETLFNSRSLGLNMKIFWKAFLFISAPLTGFLLIPLILGLLSTGPPSILVPSEAWIMLTGAVILSAITAFFWAKIVYPRLHRSLEENYQIEWERGELMIGSAFLLSILGLGLVYKPCIFTSEPYCRGIIPATDILVQTFSNADLSFNPLDQRASAVIGSYIGLLITSTIFFEGVFSRMLFYWHHRKR